VPVPEDDIAHVANTQAVDHDVALGHLTVDAPPIGAEFEHRAAFHDKDVLPWHAHLLRHEGVVHQVAVLAMDRHKEAGPDKVEHQLVLLPAGVPRNVDLHPLVVIDVGASAEEVVDRAVDQFLVAWNGRSGDDDAVARTDVHCAVLAPGHAHQGRGRLALAASAGDGYFVGRESIHLLWRQQFLRRQV